MYSAQLLDHFQNPRHVGDLDGDPAAVRIELSNPACGDILRLAARFHDGRIVAVAFKVRGCTASIAAGSALTELIHGRTKAELKTLRAADIEAALGGLEPASRHAAVLCLDAVKRLIETHGV